MLIRLGSNRMIRNLKARTSLQELIASDLDPLRSALLNHGVYDRLSGARDLRVFMEHHVFAVWDFMSLLKSLQQRLTCVTSPWIPVGDPLARRLVNEIVLGEESDHRPNGTPASHFEIYLEAMNDAGADTTRVQHMIGLIRQGTRVADALVTVEAPNPVADFVAHTFDVIDKGRPHEIAAAFTYGREDLIPAMFHELVTRLQSEFPGRLSVLRYYLDRHIQLDGDEHGHMGRAMVDVLCRHEPQLEHEAREAAVAALKARLRLWDGIERAIKGEGNQPPN